MKIKVAWIGKTKDPAIQALTAEYLKRLSAYTQVEPLAVGSEAALLRLASRTGNRPATRLVLLDTRGKQFASEEFATFLDEQQGHGGQPLLFAIGPADGFSQEARKAASVLISLGKMTLPHELARVVLLEQLYRAFTILKGHPYHLGH
ncbi:MAG TPA: 23S rRNA (pseudouridine(1915)-N(3))-methyltransferase RlmH [Terriglobales bacterium]|jgi:23S rRNA (pseudouridine1915-N3)-methyltransferase|nr:23S rRNA (pseudouridine(1915)-N(3))-methyltransferase RlmH [Terriglobales bacterium]